jgi:hypothetical protein
MNFKLLYIESLRRRKNEERMKRKFDDTDDEELSRQTADYLKKTELEIQIVKLFIFSNYTLITLLDMQNDCRR